MHQYIMESTVNFFFKFIYLFIHDFIIDHAI